jgi:hypothetical protein
MTTFCTLVILLLTAPGASQVAPPTWRVRSSYLFIAIYLFIRGFQKPNITTSRAERVDLAGAALDVAIGQLSSDGQFDGAAVTLASCDMADMRFSLSRTVQNRGGPVFSNGAVRHCNKSNEV